MSGRQKYPARQPVVRQADNAAYLKNLNAVGLIQTSVVIPRTKVVELRAITAEWRAEARALLASDLPTADQILQIHSIARELDLPLPVEAFKTRGTAAQWLLAHEPELADAVLQRQKIGGPHRATRRGA